MTANCHVLDRECAPLIEPLVDVALTCSSFDPADSSLENPSRRSQKKTSMGVAAFGFAVVLLASAVPSAMAQSCISLAGSTMCPAFNQSSISTSSTLTSLFPFLQFVGDRESFDTQLTQYIASSYSQQKYQDLLGCSSVNLTNTTNIYARYTTSVLCNAIIQNSANDCNLSGNASRPLCADSCAQFAISEQSIVASPELCGTAGSNAISQIRADFTNCALPADSLSVTCITGAENENENCGYRSNLAGLCSFCATSSPNATDSCCVNSQAESRCDNVVLPTTTSMPPLFPSSTTTSTPTSTATPGGSSSRRLSAGQIAGIVIGSVVGALVILTLIICACIIFRRRRQSQAGSIFNQPSPARSGPVPTQMTYTDGSRMPEVLPGARVARMSALENSSNATHSERNGSSRLGTGATREYLSSSDASRSPRSNHSAGFLAGPLPKRTGSLSSGSALAATVMESPHSPPTSSDNGGFSSPEGVGSGQSEQLQFFKDYYSQDEIRPGDAVSTLWAYQPRANDEFELERGDMLKIVGIWDDGWATGIKLGERAEDWEARRHLQRDSGVSSTSRNVGPVDGEIKAFPLVCVCLPQHWTKTIQGEASEMGPSGTGYPGDGRHPPPEL